MSERKKNRRESIAIVGIANRFPGEASSSEKLWKNLKNRVNGITDIPKNRWDYRKYYDENPDIPGKMFVKRGGFLKEDIDTFDPLFFGMSPREAAVVDPQQKLLLEVAWEAVEDAGLTFDEFTGSRTGVFVGGFTLDNKLLQLGSLNRDIINSHTATSSTMVIMSNRISYLFNLKGPSLTMDTACSSSVVATHYAVSSIRNGDCDMAVVGGVNVMLKPEYPIAMSKGGFLSKHGYSKAFDADAEGYVRAEGAGMILLKPLSRAVEDGDDIISVILETGVNQDGQTSGISLPNPDAQRDLIREVCGRAGVNPEKIDYFEAHGTGTKAGDPAEIGALSEVIKKRDKNKPCYVGSIKSNIGHLEAAAGVAGIIKASLVLKNGEVPPNLHFNNPNPDIDFDSTALEVPVEIKKLDENSTEHYAGVNSFGYGGTNGHVLLSSPPKKKSRAVAVDLKKMRLFPFSTRGEEALRDRARQYVDFLETGDVSMRDLVHSLSSRRSHFKNRLVCAANSDAELIEQLKTYAEDGFAPGVMEDVAKGSGKLTFVFTGMGPQWWKMGRELYENEPVFRKEVDECDKIFIKYSGWSIKEEMLKSETRSRMKSTEVAQPANFVLQAGIFRLLEHYGVKPDAVVGHSVGEVSSAYASGALSREDAVLVSYHRSRLQSTCANQGGGMLAVGFSEKEAEKAIADYDDISVAAINSADTVTLSGELSSLKKVSAILEDKNIFNKFLNVEVAYHSPHMDSIEKELKDVLSVLSPSETDVPLYATVSGKKIDGKKLSSEYWWSNARNSVRFADALNSILDNGETDFIEIGPHPVLRNAIKDVLKLRKSESKTMQTLNRKTDEYRTFYESLGKLHATGHPLKWSSFYSEGAAYIKLPSYPWQKEHYWHETDMSREERLGRDSYIYFNESLRTPDPTWKVEINPYLFPYLNDHKVNGSVIFPGAAYTDVGIAMHDEIFEEKSCTVENLKFHNVLSAEGKDNPLMISRYDEKTSVYKVFSREKSQENGAWRLNAEGRILQKPLNHNLPEVDVDAEMSFCPEVLDSSDFYEMLEGMGLNYGPYFRAVKEVRKSAYRVFTKIGADERIRENRNEYLLHPTILDAAFQSFVAVVADSENNDPFVPVSIERVDFHSRPHFECMSCAKITERTDREIKGDIKIFNADGTVCAEVHGLSCRAVRGSASESRNIEEFFHVANWKYSDPVDADNAENAEVVLFSYNSDLSKNLIKTLKKREISHLIIKNGEKFEKRAKNTYTLNTSDENHLQKLFKSEPDINTVIHAGHTEKSDFSMEKTLDATMNFVSVVKAVEKSNSNDKMKFSFVTRAAVPVEKEGEAVNLNTTGVTALGQLVENEIPGFTVKMIDLDTEEKEDEAELVVDESLSDDGAGDVAYRDERRYVKHIEQYETEEKDGDDFEEISTDEPLSVKMEETGKLESFVFETSERKKPEKDEVEVKIYSSSLNFKDLLKAYGRIDPSVLEGTYFGNGIGMESSGIITAVGENVTDWKVGDEVITPVRGSSFRTYATVPTIFVVPKPKNISFAQATNCIGYLTAYRSLAEIGRLEKGEKVLIHNATGGVGIPAVQVAMEKGAEIFATAGSEKKRKYLRTLGIKHVMNSRDLAFVDEIRRITEGKGVDVVLNAIGGEALYQSLSILAPYGRFIEIGKKDISENNGLPLKHFNKNLTFAAIDIDRMFQDRQEKIREMLFSIVEKTEKGVYSANPVSEFGADE
ncbi:MAG: beta-ketoacyl synthase N-terminal-like domain-containing protein, partial [bacterium]